MRRGQFTERQIVAARRQGEGNPAGAEMCRKLTACELRSTGISERIVLTSTGSRHWRKRDRGSRHGGSTTIPCDPTKRCNSGHPDFEAGWRAQQQAAD